MAYPEYLPRQTLYHYTSMDGLSAIASSKCLRFSDLAAANDPREIYLGREKVFVALRSVLDAEYKEGKGANLLHLITRLIGYFEGVQAFCCCLSLAEDSLPMWNAYAANHAGLSIGFRPRAILDATGRIQRVKYLDSSNDGDFRSLALEIATQVQNPADVVNFIDAGTSAITAATALKHNTWAHENEVRLVYVQRKERPEGEAAKFPISHTPDGKDVGWRQPLERLVNGEAVRYFDFPFGKFEAGQYNSSRSIERVIIGPKCKLSENDVSGILAEQGFDGFVVRKSDCQIRY